jgi:hypothetical protein
VYQGHKERRRKKPRINTDEHRPGKAGTKEVNHESNRIRRISREGTADSAKVADKDERLPEENRENAKVRRVRKVLMVKNARGGWWAAAGVCVGGG